MPMPGFIKRVLHVTATPKTRCLRAGVPGQKLYHLVVRIRMLPVCRDPYRPEAGTAVFAAMRRQKPVVDSVANDLGHRGLDRMLTFGVEDLAGEVALAVVALSIHEDWQEADRYLNTIHLKEHRRERMFPNRTEVPCHDRNQIAENAVENIANVFSKLKEFRAVAMRCGKTDESFAATILLVAGAVEAT